MMNSSWDSESESGFGEVGVLGEKMLSSMLASFTSGNSSSLSSLYLMSLGVITIAGVS
jgi:hypothetical protein